MAVAEEAMVETDERDIGAVGGGGDADGGADKKTVAMEGCSGMQGWTRRKWTTPYEETTGERRQQQRSGRWVG